MSETGLFKTFCLEQYKKKHRISGVEALQTFEQNDVLSYLQDCYEPLHTQGAGYVIDNIDDYIAEYLKDGWNEK